MGNPRCPLGSQDDATEEVTLEVNLNGFGVWQPGGNEDIDLTTDFGAGGDVSALDIAAATGFSGENENLPNTTYSFVLAPAIPEPSAATLLGLGALGLLARRRQK